MAAETFLMYVIMTVVGFLIGYSGGRSIGQEEGEREGVARAPLQLRETAYRRGLCPICGATPSATTEESTQGNRTAAGSVDQGEQGQPAEEMAKATASGG